MDELQAKLMDEGYAVEKKSSRKLIRGTKIKKEDYLTVKSENLRGFFSPLDGHLLIGGDTIAPDDVNLIELYESEYRLPVHRLVPMSLGGLLAGSLLALWYKGLMWYISYIS